MHHFSRATSHATIRTGKNSTLLDTDHPVPSMFTIGSPVSSPSKSVERAVETEGEGGSEGEGEGEGAAVEIVATPPRGRSQTYVSPPSTTTSIAAAPNVIDMFKVGDLVEGRYKRGHKWYKGRVTGIDKEKHTLDLQVRHPKILPHREHEHEYDFDRDPCPNFVYARAACTWFCAKSWCRHVKKKQKTI